MPLVIDTYNVLHTVGVLPPELAGLDIAGLARLIGESRHRDEKTTLVCDGLPVGEKIEIEPPVTVRFAGRGRTADDLIGQIVRASSAPRRLMVVSSDHAVLRTARKRRCKVLTSGEFLQQLTDDAVAAGVVKRSASTVRRPHGLNDEQVDRWVKIFKIDERTASIPARGNSCEEPPPSDSEHSDQASTSPSLDKAAPVSSPIRKLRPGQETPDAIIEQAERLCRQSQQPHPDNT